MVIINSFSFSKFINNTKQIMPLIYLVGIYQIVLCPLGILQKAIIKIIDKKLYYSHDLFIDTKYLKIKIYVREIGINIAL